MSMIEQSKKVLMSNFSRKRVLFHLDTYAPYILNETASEIWDFLKTPKDTREVVEYLCKRYDIKAKKARVDIKRLVRELKKKKLVQLYDALSTR